MTVDHLATSAMPYDLYIAIFIGFVMSFGLAIVFAAKKVADALKRADAHDLRSVAGHTVTVVRHAAGSNH